MTGAEADVPVLARIDGAAFFRRTEAYREEVRGWLRANGVNPNDVTVARDVEVVLIDVPAIIFEEFVRDADGHVLIDPACADLPAGDRWPYTRLVHTLLRVPLPEHLVDPPDRGDR